MIPRLFLALLFGLGLTCTAWADTPAKKCRYVNLKTLPITFAGRQPTVEGSVNGKTVTMLLDTGSYRTWLTRKGVESLGIAVGHSNQLVYGISGESTVYRARVTEIAIGPVKRNAMTLGVIWDIAGKPSYDAVIGTDFLFQRDLEISIAEQRASFFHPVDCKDAFLAYWDRDAFVANFGPAGAPGDPPHVVVEINGQKVRAIIDSGASASAIDLAAAARAGITPQSAGVVKGKMAAGTGKRFIPTFIAPLERIAIGNATIRDVKITIMDLWSAAEEDARYGVRDVWPEMILGIDFLRANRVLLAMSQRRLYFSYLGGEMFEVTPE
jgi:predicted aspartyl protease